MTISRKTHQPCGEEGPEQDKAEALGEGPVAGEGLAA